MMSLPLSVYERLPQRLPLSSGFSRYALNFDGAENYVKVPHSDALNIATGNRISIEMLANFIGWQAGYGVGCPIDKRTEAEANYNWEFNDTIMMMRIHAGGGVWVVSTPHSLNVWNHYVMTLDGSVLKGYLNGELKEQRTDVPTSGTNTVDLFVSCNIGYVFKAEGDVALVRIYNRALKEQEIRHNMLDYHNPVRDGLVLWLDLEEGMGLKAYDKSGYGNDGDLLPTANPPKWIGNKMWELRWFT